MEKTPNILIVDDDPRMTDSLKTILESEGYKVQTSTDSDSALEYLLKNIFDLALLDVLMPEMSGFEIMDALDRRNIDTAFIMMTGDASIESAIEAVRKGANDYIRKPFEPDELLIRVKNILRQKSLNEEHKKVEGQKLMLEKQLLQSQKMESIGTLTGGIAHDFNNILGIILGNIELMIEHVREEEKIYSNLKKIHTACLRGKEMISSLLSFSCTNNIKRKPVKLANIIMESLKLMRSYLPKDIKIKHDIHDSSCTVLADVTQIHQVIMNLCTNAAHAMQENGGIIEIQFEEDITLDENSILNFSDLSPGKYARFTVSDTGHGITRDIIDRIFEPYFTTKEVNKGTGMGLSVVHGIVKNHGGEIKVYSEPNKKTSFTVYLPMTEEVPEKDEKEIEGELEKGKEHILIVDDEYMLCDILKEMIEYLGYRVTVCTDSMEALERFRVDPYEFNLVITDMSMPHMNGDVLTKNIRKIRKNIPIIICTGYSEKLNREKARMIGIQDFIMKPISMSTLAKAIRKRLDSSFVDRRRNKRFIVKDSAVAISKANPFNQGEIVDISMTGLAYVYQKNGDTINDFDELSIKIIDNGFYLGNLSYETVSDIIMVADSLALSSDMRRRGVNFKELTDSQKEQLKFFIQHHTIEAANNYIKKT